MSANRLRLASVRWRDGWRVFRRRVAGGGATMVIEFYQPSWSKGRHRQPRLSRSRPQVELLESRCLMSFQVLAALGDTVAGAGFRINDFEPNGLNNCGDVLYGDDLGTANDPSTFYGEGIFLRSQGHETLLARTNTSAPGGGTYDFGFLGPSALNDSGDVAYAFTLQPVGSPFGVHAGTYRF